MLRGPVRLLGRLKRGDRVLRDPAAPRREPSDQVERGECDRRRCRSRAFAITPTRSRSTANGARAVSPRTSPPRIATRWAIRCGFSAADRVERRDRDHLGVAASGGLGCRRPRRDQVPCEVSHLADLHRVHESGGEGRAGQNGRPDGGRDGGGLEVRPVEVGVGTGRRSTSPIRCFAGARNSTRTSWEERCVADPRGPIGRPDPQPPRLLMPRRSPGETSSCARSRRPGSG